MSITKDTIIISDLSREQTLTIPNSIKQEINYFEKIQDEQEVISHWADLTGLNRLVIVFKDSKVAQNIFEVIRNKYPNLHVHLSESILKKHKSNENLQQPSADAPKLYQEPRPRSNSSDFSSLIIPDFLNSSTDHKKLTILEPLKISSPEKASGELSPRSPTITLENVDADHGK
ncbi:hypothetical protein WICMUC_003572 [Wickerhamomyces mucosus]|uniref:Uncharacterized protein n=1 Tax=Wickerhamomyces mucosus TaxID=1378264 RepID=A0A9P8TCH0_9ASCO|nr:hypothetical protein WICMUC_003572 [Wickerhamomyces mucosus]